MTSKKTLTAKIKKQDGGFYFPDFDIHVVAEDEDEAKRMVKIGHGLDVDKATEELEVQRKVAKEQEQAAAKATEIK